MRRSGHLLGHPRLTPSTTEPFGSIQEGERILRGRRPSPHLFDSSSCRQSAAPLPSALKGRCLPACRHRRTAGLTGLSIPEVAAPRPGLGQPSGSFAAHGCQADDELSNHAVGRMADSGCRTRRYRTPITSPPRYRVLQLRDRREHPSLGPEFRHATSYLLNAPTDIPLRDSFAVEKAGRVWLGPRGPLRRHDAARNIADTILPAAPVEFR